MFCPMCIQVGSPPLASRYGGLEFFKHRHLASGNSSREPERSVTVSAQVEPSESLGRFWALEALRSAVPFRLRSPLAKSDSEAYGVYLGELVRAAGGGVELEGLAEDAARQGLSDDALSALEERCRRLQREILTHLRAAQPAPERSLVSLLAMFGYATRRPPVPDELILGTLGAGLGTSISRVVISADLERLIHGEDSATLRAAEILGEAVPAPWREGLTRKWKQLSFNDLLPVGMRGFDDLFKSAILRYRVAEECRVKAPEHTWSAIESRAMYELGQRWDGVLGHALAEVSRSPRMTGAVRDALPLALRALLDCQEPDGSWSEWHHPLSIRATSGAVLALSRLGSEDRHRLAADRGAEWLLGRQTKAGAWRMRPSKGGPRNCALTTAMALQGLAAAGFCGEDSVARAASWLTEQQTGLGLWRGVFGRDWIYTTEVDERFFYPTARALDALAEYDRGVAAPEGEDVPGGSDEATAAIYERVIDQIRLAAADIEQSPAVYGVIGEEAIRHLLRFRINGALGGLLNAETENVAGRTDLLLRHGGRNAFIGECKHWSGPRSFSAAVNQLLRYTNWRDRFLALIVFSRNRQPGRVVASAHRALEGHPSFKTWAAAPTGELRADVVLPGDGSLASLHVFVIQIPSAVG
jgi:Squalene-hopene cyclase C-terminal domain